MWSRMGFGSFESCLVGGSGAAWRRLGLWRARRFGSGAGFGFRRLIGFGSTQSWSVARQATIQTHQQRPNKALHPTVYSPAVRASLWRFRQRVSLVVSPQRAAWLRAPKTK